MRSSRTIACVLLLALLLSACDSADNTNPLPSLIDASGSGDLKLMDEYLISPQMADMRNACLWTPLMMAALNGQQQAVAKLLDKHAEVDLVDKGGYSAMMLAASNNFAAIVEMLIEQGADVNRVETSNGWTALIWAAKQGHDDTVRVLLRHHADKTIKDLSGNTAIDYARQKELHSTLELLLRK